MNALHKILPLIVLGYVGTNGGDGLQEDVYAYGEMYSAAPIAITIGAINTPQPITTLVTGHTDYVTFTANATGAITAYADGTGKVNVTDAAHGLATGDVVCIVDSTNYNGCWEITKINDNSFSIPDTWVADDGASNWVQGDRLVIQKAGDYEMMASFSLTKGAGVSTTSYLQAYINNTAEANCKITREIASSDTGALAFSCVLDALAIGDEVFVVYSGTTTNAITTTNANVQIHLLH